MKNETKTAKHCDFLSNVFQNCSKRDLQTSSQAFGELLRVKTCKRMSSEMTSRSQLSWSQTASDLSWFPQTPAAFSIASSQLCGPQPSFIPRCNREVENRRINESANRKMEKSRFTLSLRRCKTTGWKEEDRKKCREVSESETVDGMATTTERQQTFPQLEVWEYVGAAGYNLTLLT